MKTRDQVLAGKAADETVQADRVAAWQAAILAVTVLDAATYAHDLLEDYTPEPNKTFRLFELARETELPASTCHDLFRGFRPTSGPWTPAEDALIQLVYKQAAELMKEHGWKVHYNFYSLTPR